MIYPIRTFTVVSFLPPQLQRLRELAYNLWWCWDHEALALFRRMDPDLWEETGHNPAKLLGTIRQEQLNALAADESFLSHLQRVCERFDAYMAGVGWYEHIYGAAKSPLIAYFSAEFGVTESLALYSGGLGILAGDHLKSAAELGLPLAGVGLLYQVGYHHQYLNVDGWQNERYPVNDFYNMPITLERGPEGMPITIPVAYPGRIVNAQVWRIQVGKVALYMLDTNISQNSAADRRITGELYGGDMEMRMQQEIMLGIGGVLALHTLDIHPQVYHMNEGHSAFLALERVRRSMVKHGLNFAEAREATQAGNIFTTHTPVPEGIDVFPPSMMERYFGQYFPHLGLDQQQFLSLGRQDPRDPQENFSMAVLALRLSAYANGVSNLHGRVSRRMWRSVWPGVPEKEIPITSITNGIHQRSWISPDLALLYERYLGPRWITNPADQTVWERVDKIPGDELWVNHERRRERLVATARRLVREQREQSGAPPSELAEADEILNPEVLTIGFARRFAPYKRATMLLRDLDRLEKILCNKDRPVQIIFAGKAHPKNDPGKELIKRIIHVSRQDRFRRRIVFLENYDMVIARYIVQGADVWLNNPRRPLEASGTSGMKSSANGGLNLSVLDGWWDEAYSPEVGWAIGSGEEYADPDYQDAVEVNALYNLLEKEVVPLFYDRGPDNMPRGWIARMKASMRSICPVFNTNRMVSEYTERLYRPAMLRFRSLSADGMEGAKKLAAWRERLHGLWSRIRIEEVQTDGLGEAKVGTNLEIQARLYLDALTPDDVTVEIFRGPVNSNGEIVDGQAISLEQKVAQGNGRFLFTGKITCDSSGLYGYTLRILPRHEDLCHPYEPNYILWAL